VFTECVHCNHCNWDTSADEVSSQQSHDKWCQEVWCYMRQWRAAAHVQHTEFSPRTPMPSSDPTDKIPVGWHQGSLVATAQALDILSSDKEIASAATLLLGVLFTLWFQTYGAYCIIITVYFMPWIIGWTYTLSLLSFHCSVLSYSSFLHRHVSNLIQSTVYCALMLLPHTSLYSLLL
jgi:hypothetical protein